MPIFFGGGMGYLGCGLNIGSAAILLLSSFSLAVADPIDVNLENLFASANRARGEELSSQCQGCHGFDRFGLRQFGVGPSLWNVFGRPFARVRTYSYSNSLSQKQGSWGARELLAFLEDPRTFVPGTKMNFPGIEDAGDRADLVLFLNSLSADPRPLVELATDVGAVVPIEILGPQLPEILTNNGPVTTGGNFEDGFVAPIEFDARMAELGRRLFFDPRLSGDAAISCASCHDPEHGFSDGLALSNAYPGSLGFRNTPTLINTAHKSAWFHDGRIGTNLNDVTRESITETYVMNMDMRLMQERLKQDPIYVRMFAEAGLGEPSNGGVRNAIPEFLKTLTSRNSPFPNSLSPSAQRGLGLFSGKAGCANCHSGSRFTDDTPHNIAVPENREIWADPLRHITYVSFAKFIGIENYMNIRRDVGAHVRTHRVDGADIGTFMTPTLRELIYTAPYMHNGVFATLDEVVAFYNEGAGQDQNKDPLIRPLGLSIEEQSDLVNFLISLSGEPLTGPDFVWQENISTSYLAIENWPKIRN